MKHHEHLTTARQFIADNPQEAHPENMLARIMALEGPDKAPKADKAPTPAKKKK